MKASNQAGTRTFAAVAATAILMFGAAAAPASAEPDELSVIATFEGERIALADGWGQAGACVVDVDGTRCYRTEAEMDEREGLSIERQRRSGEFFAASTCSSSLRLYQNAGFGGSVLHFSTQHTYINLWGYGFNNVTSSYRVGACTSYLYDGSNGGAPIYPGSTSPYSSASSMVSGWDNRISSLYVT
jgi:hypothetical protein